MQPFALFVRGPSGDMFNIAEKLGFDDEMNALAVSVFEDSPEFMQVQALFETETEATSSLNSLNLPSDIEAFVAQLPDEDWVSKSQEGLPPVQAGRFWVYGTHDADSIPKDAIWPIQVDAGMAFGTGHHGTTKGCLIIFDNLLKNGFQPDDVLDLGCGAGILAIAAAKALDQMVTATDIDSAAVEVTDTNAQINGVAPLITSAAADGFDSPALAGKTFDLIFANILAGPLMGLAPDISEALAPNGRVILSGILDEQAENVADAFGAAEISTTAQPSVSGWTSLLGIKKA